MVMVNMVNTIASRGGLVGGEGGRGGGRVDWTVKKRLGISLQK